MTILRAAFGLIVSTLVAAAAPALVYTNIAPGVSYCHLNQPEIPLSIHVVKFDYSRTDLRLTSTLGRSNIFGLRNLVSQIKYLPASMGQPIAGINGDFFHIKKEPYQGDPDGLQIMEGELVSSPSTRVAGVSVRLDSQGVPAAGHVESKLRVVWPNNFSVPFGVNEERGSDKAALLTPRLGATTRTTNGVEFILEREGAGPWLPLRADQTYSARVRAVSPTSNTAIAPDVMVLSLGPKLAKKIPPTIVGTVLKISTDISPNVAGDATAVGGWPMLVDHGKIRDDYKDKKTRAPRTAVGWNEKEFYMVVVDGRQKKLSQGMSFPEMAVEMAELGCTEAVNLDGGGSTTMWVKGKVVNSPSDGRERSLGNALVLVQKK